ncbi:MAG: adenosylhomocysteinase [Deltaproteobacteria bacterium]|jgi:adenosylhomocysteinase
MNDFEVKDLQLAERGRDAIRRAERQMPGLLSLRKTHADTQPLAGARIAGCLHATVETAVLIETLVALGADVRWCSSNILTTHDAAMAAVAKAGVPVFAFAGETTEDYWRLLDRAMTWPDGRGPDLLVDDGGDATWYLHAGAAARAEGDAEALRRIALKREAAPEWFAETIDGLVGLSEETTTGVLRLDDMERRGTLRCAAIDVNNSVTKSKFDNVYGCRESLVDAIKRATDLMLSGKRALVCGFGDVGKGSAAALEAHRCRVVVSEVDPICALQACMAGYDVARVDDVIGDVDIVVTATGNHGVVTADQIERMKDGAVLCNIGHFDVEVDVAGLARRAKRQQVEPGLDRYVFEDGHAVYLLGEGRLVNLACANGHPAFVMSMSFTNQVLAQLYLWQRRPDVKLERLPKALDEEVARLHLDAFGARLTDLTAAQAAYLGVAVDGPYKPEHYRY